MSTALHFETGGSSGGSDLGGANGGVIKSITFCGLQAQATTVKVYENGSSGDVLYDLLSDGTTIQVMCSDVDYAGQLHVTLSQSNSSVTVEVA